MKSDVTSFRREQRLLLQANGCTPPSLLSLSFPCLPPCSLFVVRRNRPVLPPLPPFPGPRCFQVETDARLALFLPSTFCARISLIILSLSPHHTWRKMKLLCFHRSLSVPHFLSLSLFDSFARETGSSLSSTNNWRDEKHMKRIGREREGE